MQGIQEPGETWSQAKKRLDDAAIADCRQRGLDPYEMWSGDLYHHSAFHRVKLPRYAWFLMWRLQSAGIWRSDKDFFDEGALRRLFDYQRRFA